MRPARGIDPERGADAAPLPAPSRAPSRAAANTKVFWALMQSWGVPDGDALELIGHPGKLTRVGKRPRFRLSTKQVQMLEYLQEIDQAVRMLFGDPGQWVRTRQRSAPMRGKPPIRLMIEGGARGMAEVLRGLRLTAMKRAISE